jgi:hypothetical protein
MNARIIEKTISVEEVATSSSDVTGAIDLNGAEKFSIQVVATVGDCIANLQGSNDGSNWTELDTTSIAEGASDMFEQADCDYRWAQVEIENNDVVDVSADCVVLVIGDGE